MLRVSRRKPVVASQRFQKATEQQEAEFARLLAEAMKALGSPSLSDEVLNAIAGGQIEPFLDALQWAEFLQYVGRLRASLAAQASMAGLNSFRLVIEASPVLPVRGATFLTNFRMVDQRAVSWAEREAARLVVQVSDEIRQNIRLLTRDSLTGIYTPQELARQIKAFIPLHEKWAIAVIRRRDRLYADYIRDGLDPLKAKEKALNASIRYAEKLARVRSRTIARTELMTAMGEGQMMGWAEADASGYIGTGWMKEWLTAEDERVCPTCGPLNGQKVEWNKPFDFGGMNSPRHPNCRCDVQLIPEDI